MLNFQIDIEDRTGRYGRQLNDIRQNAEYAGREFSSLFKSPPGEIRVLISLERGGDAQASAASVTNQFVETKNGFNVFDHSAAIIAKTGVDINGSEYDVQVNVFSEYLDTVAFIDPTPNTRSDIPSGADDLISVLRHEFLHAFCFAGFLGNSITDDASPYDLNVEFRNNKPFFIGEAAVEVFEGAVPLGDFSPESYHHYYGQLGQPQGLLRGLMATAVDHGFEISPFPFDYDVQLSNLDAAILIDCGFSLNGPLGSHTNDSISGGASVDNLYGFGGNDFLRGFAGDDTLSGGSGSDTLIGGTGRDTLIGGAGNDFFLFEDLPAKKSNDVVIDFVSGVDRVFIPGGLVGLEGGPVGSELFVRGKKATSSEHRFVYNGKALSFDADGSGKTKAVVITQVVGLQGSDIEIVGQSAG